MMDYQTLAMDYDGTIATQGKVEQSTYLALKRWQETGRKLIMVTGRRLDNLYDIFPEVSTFDCIVAENGALISFPTDNKTILLGETPPNSLIEALQKRQVEPLFIGQSIISTWVHNSQITAEVIAELGLSWQANLNKHTVMLLPKGVDKYSGLKTALSQMDLTPEQIVGVGDGENDLPLLKLCGLSVSVANALPMLKDCSDWIMTQNSGDGVAELIDKLLEKSGVK